MGADGGRSSVAKRMYETGSKFLPRLTDGKTELGIEFSGPGNMGTAFNIECTMDLNNAMKQRSGNLHYVLYPDAPDWAWFTCLRMVRPWTEWIMVTFPKPGFEHANERRSEDDYIKLARKLAGVADLPVKITGISKWNVNGEIASGHGKGRVLCLGDAVHRHPPIVSLSDFSNYESYA
jgi:2-polyprenyl-6-methoxyphenol hydroxylase-like FAD-dependent oxidoreductase